MTANNMLKLKVDSNLVLFSCFLLISVNGFVLADNRLKLKIEANVVVFSSFLKFLC